MCLDRHEHPVTATYRGPSLLRSLASSWLGLAAGIGIAFFLSPFVVNKLGAAWYGVWAIAAQFTGYLYLLDFGVRESVIRYTSKYAARQQPAQLNRVLTAALMIYTGITVVAVAGIVIFVWGVPHWLSLPQQYWTDTRYAMFFTGLTIAQTFVFNVFSGVVSGLRRWDIGNAMGVVINLVRAALLVLFLQAGYGIVAVAAIQFGVALGAGIATTVVAFTLLNRVGMPFRLVSLSRRRFRKMSGSIFGYGTYVIINNVGEKLIGATDAIVVGIFLSVEAVAHFAIAGSLVGYLKAILGTTAQVFNPLASHLRTARQSEELRHALLLGVAINVLIALPVTTTFVLLGQQFIALWMGNDFAGPAGPVLAVLAVTAVLTAPQSVVSSVLYGISRHRTIALLRITEAAANLVLSVAFVKAIGLVGVALGTAVPSAVIVLLVLPAQVCPMLGIRLGDYYERAYLRPLLAALPFALGAYWLRTMAMPQSLPAFLASIAALTMLYLPCALVIGFTAPERDLILRRYGWRTA
jgi:O-antigen/teichoic acid export membrane protein